MRKSVLVVVIVAVVVLVVCAVAITERRRDTVERPRTRTEVCCPQTTTPSPTASSRPATPEPCRGWLSGSTGASTANGSFGEWRGAPAEIGGVWQYGSDLKDLQPGAEFGDWRGALDVAVVPPDFQNWQAEATGAHDEFWRQTFRNANTLRQGRGRTFVRPYWEYNGDWYQWSVRTPEDAANFKLAWARMAAIFRTEFPSGTLMLGTTASDRIAVSDTYPDRDDVDVLSIDFYNNYPHVDTQREFERKIESGSDPNSLMDLMRLAKDKGDPVLISEWSNVGPAPEGGGSDAPEFITAFYNFLVDNCGDGPGEVIGELVFNFPSHDAGQFWMWEDGRTNPAQTQTAARYRELFGGV